MEPNGQNSEEQEELLARGVVGELGAADLKRLVEQCRRDPELVARLGEHVLVERLLGVAARDPRGEMLCREVLMGLAAGGGAEFAERVKARVVARRRQGFWLKLAACLLVCGAGWFALRKPQGAEVVRVESWAALEPGQKFAPGRKISLESGLVELRFGCGAQVIVEGPAELWVQSGWSARLERGRVVARVPEEAHGFTIEGRGGKLVDLGTEFGVSVGEKEGMEVHVLEGVVEAHPSAGGGTVRLERDQALRLSDAPLRLASNRGAFVRTLPPVPENQTGYVHWDFEGTESVIPDRGRDLAGTDGIRDLELVRVTAALGLPVRVAGRFGQGVEFTGEGSYARSDFPGIGGSDARTVAFWVKVPADFDVGHGYGVIGWGSHAEPGSAWQISINPAEAEGPIGRLRVGVNRAPVVGTTDLRDGNWHHCAVVLYGGAGADISTHVLLYVDGRLEPAARKAVMEVNTDLQGPNRGVWLGRNISGAVKGFRGGVDEVYVFGCALDHVQVDRLFRENRLEGKPAGKGR
jgi:hypothetical protein